MNRNRIATLVGLLGAVPSLAACDLLHKSSGASQQAIIKSAEAKSFWGANPGWLHFSTQKALFRRVRDRAYGYCLKRGAIDPRCASEQDDAVQSSVMALMISGLQAQMENKDKLGKKEHYLATNPAITRSVVNTCWALYKEHGASDARLLSVCLGNLSDYSPLAPLPVP